MGVRLEARGNDLIEAVDIAKLLGSRGRLRFWRRSVVDCTDAGYGMYAIMNGESKQGMYGDAGVCRLLRQIVSRCSKDPCTREDLMQECLVHLWLKEHEQPGQTRSWYLQSCRFHAQHYLDLGTSLDSPKRANGHKLPLDGLEEEPALAHHRDEELLQQVSARDLVEALMPRLTPRQRNVLCGLAQGLDLREIATRTGLSYPTVLKYRNRIACLVLKLGAPGVPPPPHILQGQPPARTNGHVQNDPDGNAKSGSRATRVDPLQLDFALA